MSYLQINLFQKWKNSWLFLKIKTYAGFSFEYLLHLKRQSYKISYFPHRINPLFQPTLNGGATSTTPSPRTKSIGIFRFVDWKRKKKKHRTHLYKFVVVVFIFRERNLKTKNHRFIITQTNCLKNLITYLCGTKNHLLTVSFPGTHLGQRRQLPTQPFLPLLLAHS